MHPQLYLAKQTVRYDSPLVQAFPLRLAAQLGDAMELVEMVSELDLRVW